MFVYRKNVLGYTRLSKRCYTSTKHELKISPLKNGCEKSWMKSIKVRPTLPTPIEPFGENCSKENRNKWWLLYFLGVNCWFCFRFVQSVADLPSEYWQIQRLIKFLKVRVSSLLKQWIRELIDNSKQEKATNRGKQYGIMARKWRMKKDCWLFHGRIRMLETSAEPKGYGKAKFPSSDLSLRSRFPE